MQNPRECALDVLIKVDKKEELSHIAISNVLEKYQFSEKRDRAFFTRLVEGTLERQITIDYVADQFSKTKIRKCKPLIRALLRMGIYQILYMDQVPDSAACNEAVKLAKKRGFSRLSGFVNGVLRNISRKKDEIQYPSREKNLETYLSVAYSIPEWIIKFFQKTYDNETVEKIIASYLEERKTTLCCLISKGGKEAVRKELEAEGTEEAEARIENIDELITKVVSYEEENEEPTLSGFLEEVALVADIDSVDGDDNQVLLMTLHSAKGLEFPFVYLAGMEDGMFPSYMTITSDDPTEIEEERRLCYVGITRAMKDLTLTCAQQRMIRGETQYNKVSRFIKEIPRELVELGREFQEKKPMDIPMPTSFRQMKQAFKQPAFVPKQFEVKKADGLDYAVGDTVKHIKFGTGVVTAIVEGGRDYEVTVNFDKVGIKKMFASFAKLKKN